MAEEEIEEDWSLVAVVGERRLGEQRLGDAEVKSQKQTVELGGGSSRRTEQKTRA